MKPRTRNIIIVSVVTGSVSAATPIVHQLGGDYVPGVWLTFSLYAVELILASILAIKHYRSTEEREERDRYERRHNAKKDTSPSSVELESTELPLM